MQADKQIQTPLQKALLLLRPDMTLQISTGEQALEVHVTCEMAYGLALAFLANVANLKPWHGHPDAELAERAHDVGFAAIQLASKLQAPHPVNPDDRAFFTLASALVLLSDGMSKGKTANERQTAH